MHTTWSVWQVQAGVAKFALYTSNLSVTQAVHKHSHTTSGLCTHLYVSLGLAAVPGRATLRLAVCGLQALTSTFVAAALLPAKLLSGPLQLLRPTTPFRAHVDSGTRALPCPVLTPQPTTCRTCPTRA